MHLKDQPNLKTFNPTFCHHYPSSTAGGNTELGRQCSYLKQNMQAKPREEGDVGMWVLDLGLGLGHTETAAAATPRTTIPISYVANVAHMHYINPVWAKGWGLLSTCPGLKPKWNGGMNISHIPGRPHTSFPPPVLVRRVVVFFFFFALIKCVMRLEFIN